MGHSDMFRHCRTFRWLWFVFLSVAMVTGADCTERHHQHHHHYKHQHPHQDTRHSAQPELQLLPSSPADRRPPLPSECPNCIQRDEKRARTRNSDEIRLESIKRQILSKLGLKEKPNVTAPVPRDVIMETLYRAEETGDQHDGSGSGSGSDARTAAEAIAGPASTRAPDSEPDDFYGRTSEIIAFAEAGKSAVGAAPKQRRGHPIVSGFFSDAGSACRRYNWQWHAGSEELNKTTNVARTSGLQAEIRSGAPPPLRLFN
jgi:inhibin beta